MNILLVLDVPVAALLRTGCRIAAACALALAVSMPAVARAGDIIDQSRTSENLTVFYSISGGVAYGQTFTPARDAISFARFWLRPSGVGDPTVQMVVDLHAYRYVQHGHEEGWEIIEPAMARSGAKTVSEDGPVMFRFSREIGVEPGEQYALVIRLVSGTFNWMLAIVDGYTGGILVSDYGWVHGTAWFEEGDTTVATESSTWAGIKSLYR